MKILIIEDDQSLLEALRVNLENRFFVVDTAADGERGAFLGRTNSYDAIILDYNLPKLNGAEVIKEIRQDSAAPIIMLTVRAEIESKILAFNSGADAYLTKPFILEELFLIIHSLLRRPKKLETEIFKIDNLSLEIKRQKVRRAGKIINLTRKEYGLLEYLLRNRGEIITRLQIMEQVWDINGDPFSNSIDTHLANLRRKLNQNGHRNLIHTFPGRGYKLDLRKS